MQVKMGNKGLGKGVWTEECGRELKNIMGILG